MSIYPPGVDGASLGFKFELAALNLPVPDDLLSREDRNDWRNYMESLRIGQALRLYGQALDQFHELLGTTDPMTQTEEAQAKIFSKWTAASIADRVASPRFNFETQETYENPNKFFNSDIGRGLYSIVAFLKDVNSPDVKIWEDRMVRHNAIDRKLFRPFLNKWSFMNPPAAKPPAPASTP